MINLHEIKQPVIIDEDKEVDFKALLDVFNLLKIEYQNDSLSYNMFVNTVGNTWVNDGGTLPKRIKKFFKHFYNINIPNNLMGVIGDTLTNGILRSNICAEVKSRINWYEGDFGDSYSCFWGNRSGAKYLIEKHGGGGIIFYRKDGDFCENLGRCLFLPYYNDSYVFFNFYGVNGSFCKNNLSFLMEILENFFKKINEKVYIKLVHLHNLSEFDQDLLYINQKSGILVSDCEEDIKDVFLNIEYECAQCSKYCFEFGKKLENYLICADCVENYFTCKICGVETLNTQILANNDCVCHDCYSKYVKTCSICENEFLEKHVRIINDEYICRDCYDKIYRDCGICWKIIKKEEAIKVHTWIYSFYCCDECAKEIAKICPECGNYFKKDEEINGVCSDCSWKRRTQDVSETN